MSETTTVILSLSPASISPERKGLGKRQAPSTPNKIVVSKASNRMPRLGRRYLTSVKTDGTVTPPNGPPTGAQSPLDSFDFDDIMKSDPFFCNKNVGLMGRQSSFETASSLSTAIEGYEDFEEEDDDESYQEDGSVEDDGSFVEKKSAAKRRRVDDGVKQRMTAYWISKGLDKNTQVPKLVDMAYSRKLYGEPDRIDAKLTELRKLLPGVDVAKLVSNAPNLLVYNIEAKIPSKLIALQKVLPGLDVRKVVASSPHLLTFDIENNIAPKIIKLKELLPGVNVIKILRAAPNLLSYNIEDTLVPKLRQIEECMPGVDLEKLINYAPTLLYHKSMDRKIEALKRLLPGCDIVKMVSSAPPLLCSDIEGSVADKLHWIRMKVNEEAEDGAPSTDADATVDEKIEANPRLLTCGYGVIYGRLEYVGNKIVKEKLMEYFNKEKGEVVGEDFEFHPLVPVGHHLEDIMPEYNQVVPAKDLRSILLAPVTKFAKNNPTYLNFIARQLVNAHWCPERSYEDWLQWGVKKLEGEHGKYLRKIMDKK